MECEEKVISAKPTICFSLEKPKRASYWLGRKVILIRHKLMRKENDSRMLERLGYCGDETLEILGFRTCFKVKSGYDIGEESAARLHKKFNGDWQEASLWYGVVDRYHKRMKAPICERKIVNETVDELEYYQSLIMKDKDGAR